MIEMIQEVKSYSEIKNPILDKRKLVRKFAWLPINVNGKSILWEYVYFEQYNETKIFLSKKEYLILKLKMEYSNILKDIDLLKNKNKCISEKNIISLQDQFQIKQNSEKIADLIYEKYKVLNEIEIFENDLYYTNLFSKKSKRLY